MEATWIRRLAAVLGLLAATAVVKGDVPPSPTTAATPLADTPAPPGDAAKPSPLSADTQAPAADTAKGAAATGAEPAAPPADATKAAATEPTKSTPKPPAPAADAPAVRAETNDRLKRLGEVAEKDLSPTDKTLKEIFKERLRWLDAWDDAAKQLHEAQTLDTSESKDRAVDVKAELDRVTQQITLASKKPDEVLGAAFKQPAGRVSDAVVNEMRDAIESGKTALKEGNEKLERLHVEMTQGGASRLTSLRAERDKCYQQVAGLTPRRTDRETALAAAKTNSERALENERLTNFDWESRVENARLKACEARIAVETKLADVVPLTKQLYDSRVRLAEQTLELMQDRFRAVTDRQKQELDQRKVTAEKRAAVASDPLERYKAQWMAEYLDLQARVLKHESAMSAENPPSLDEQYALADRACNDFASVKHLLDDGVSQLDALRMNNDFRRIGPERDRIIRHELAECERRLAHYENVLSIVELELIEDHRADQYEHDTLLEQLPSMRHPEAKALFDEHDRQHEALLRRNRDAIEKLAKRAEQTHLQVLRRLRALDDQYGFIRTHIFWVRDREPLGLSTLATSQREILLIGKATYRLALEASDRRFAAPVSAVFVTGLVILVLLPWPVHYLRRRLRTCTPVAGGTTIAHLRTPGAIAASAALWPAYLCVLAYTVYEAPISHSVSQPIAVALAALAPVGFVAGVVCRLLRPQGWAETVAHIPCDVSKQLRKAFWLSLSGGVAFLIPLLLLDQGLIAPAGRPISVPAICRILGLGFEVTVLAIVFSLARSRSALCDWFLKFPERLGWLNRHRKVVGWSIVAGSATVVALDGLGYNFTARRLSVGIALELVVVAICWVVYRLVLRAIDHHAWRWMGIGHAPAAVGATDAQAPEDIATRLRRLTGYLTPVLGLLLTAWVWDIDWALFRYYGKQPLWPTDAENWVTVGDVSKSLFFLAVTTAIWRHLSTIFAVAVFPRMRNDPGVRFAVETLARYAVLTVGLLAGLSAVHLGPEKIGVVLAALGVGLGFGLQEIVSNFICGIILLLERPIRVGDVVTVSDMTGTVDQINIRATTIINGDNQSIIVPNRAFITGDLVNWTLTDKVVRITIRLNVAHGTDPDRVSELLLNIARDDADILRNPAPASFMEDFSDCSLSFVLHAHVPEPGLASRVRHRLFTQIQRQFRDAGIEIPLPSQELRVHPVPGFPGIKETVVTGGRVDQPSPAPPAPRFMSTQPIPEPLADCHRGVDE